MPVLHVSSRVFWLELDDKAFLDSYTVLQEGILCDVFSQKSGRSGQRFFFLLAAAWVCPGRSALQSAKHWCYGRNGHNQKLMRFIKQNNKNMRNQAGKPSTETFLIAIRKRALVKTRR